MLKAFALPHTLVELEENDGVVDSKCERNKALPGCILLGRPADNRRCWGRGTRVIRCSKCTATNRASVAVRAFRRRRVWQMSTLRSSSILKWRRVPFTSRARCRMSGELRKLGDKEHVNTSGVASSQSHHVQRNPIARTYPQRRTWLRGE